MNYAVVTTKVDSQTKKEAMKTAEALGIPLSIVVKAFLKQFIRTKSINFSVGIEEPSTGLLESLLQSEEEKKVGNVTSFATGKDALDYLDAEIENDKKNKQSS